jgi:dihydropteroate synthase
MRILQVHRPKDLKQIMQDIRVDPYGIEIMLPKAIAYLIKLNSVSSITANILKQEMLSLGADVAVSRDALTGKAKKTDCLLMGNLSQFNRLNQKLNKQPFGLNELAQDLSHILKNYKRERFTLDLGRYKLNLGRRVYIMGIINLTPDSFSADGFYPSGVGSQVSGIIIDRIEKMVEEGADIIDFGGESTRPGAKPVPVKEELSRTIPVIKAVAKKIKVPISIDTYKPQVAKLALDNGASLVNDVTGLRNPEMAKVIARYKAGVVVMHMKGNPRTMQKNPKYVSLIDELIDYLDKAIKLAKACGIDEEKIIIDPGIGFGKSVEHNLEILKRLREFKVLGKPILVGPSRKSFIGKILNVNPQQRILGEQSRTTGTVSSCVLAAKSGANILRVHDVKEVKQALSILERIENI